MTPHPETCSNKRCRNKGHTLSLDYFRQGDSPPDCYLYHRRCSDCRKTRPIPLPSQVPSPSPARATRRHCTRCHRQWSLRRFPGQSYNDQCCIYCRNRKHSMPLLMFLGSQTPSSSQLSSTLSQTSRSIPSTPNTSRSSQSRRHSPPPRTPDSTGRTPSTRRALPHRRTQSPTSPSPVQYPQPPSPLIQNRPRRIIQLRHFFGDTPTPPPPQLKLCSRHNHLKPLTDFIDENTGEELDTCNNCRNDIQFFRRRVAGLNALTQPGERLIQQQEERMRLQVIWLIQGNQPSPVDYLDQVVLTDHEQELLRGFQNALSSVTMVPVTSLYSLSLRCIPALVLRRLRRTMQKDSRRSFLWWKVLRLCWLETSGRHRDLPMEQWA